jgi:hypothetical protein
LCSIEQFGEEVKSDKDFKIGDIVYWAQTEEANLKHQPDGVELYRGIVKEDEDHKSEDLYVFYYGLEYQVGKSTYAGRGTGLDPIGRTRFNLYAFIDRMGYKIFKELADAQKDMIVHIFRKKKWL